MDRSSAPGALTPLPPLTPLGGPPAPMSARARAARIAPFTLLSLAVFPIAMVSGTPMSADLWLTVVGFALTVALVVAVPWPKLPSDAKVVPAIVFSLAIFAMREAGGGGVSGYGGSLLLLPIVWQGVFGSRRDLWLTLTVVSASLVLPIVLVGAPRYVPAVEWPRTILTILTWVTLGSVLQSLVTSVRRNERVLAEIGGRSRATRGRTDSRQSLVDAACAITRAGRAVLSEVVGGALEVRFAAGEATPEPVVQDPSSGAMEALRTGRPQFVTNRGRPKGANRVRPPASYHQPVVSEGRTIGVLSVWWTQLRRTVADGDRHALGLLAAEVAAASERADLVDRLDRIARTDALTGLPNRRSLDERLSHELLRSQRTGAPLAVAILDLDHFKSYNDRHGHQAGDQLLREVAAAWNDQIRGTDLVGRWGGEEFALVLTDADEDRARHVLGRMRTAMPDGVTFSAGVAVAEPGTTPDGLLGAADRALYAAKAAGRDRVRADRPTTPAAALH